VQRVRGRTYAIKTYTPSRDGAAGSPAAVRPRQPL